MKIRQTLLFLFLVLHAISGDFIMAESASYTFADRAKLYIKWLHHRITQEEYEIVKKRMPTDCVIAVFMGAVIMSSCIIIVKYSSQGLKEWMNLSKFRTKSEPLHHQKNVISPDDQKETISSSEQKKVISPEVQTALDSFAHIKNGGIIAIKEHKIMIGLTPQEILLQIMGATDTNLDAYPLIKEFAGHAMQQKENKDKTMAIQIYGTSGGKTTIMKYKLKDQDFIPDFTSMVKK